MKRLFYHIIAIATATCTFTACHGGQPRTAMPAGDTLVLRHAQYLTLIEHADYTEAQIHSPWNKGKLLQTVKIPLNSSQRGTSGSAMPASSLFFTTTHSYSRSMPKERSED